VGPFSDTACVGPQRSEQRGCWRSLPETKTNPSRQYIITAVKLDSVTITMVATFIIIRETMHMGALTLFN
jgi:hypothetical protein